MFRLQARGLDVPLALMAAGLAEGRTEEGQRGGGEPETRREEAPFYVMLPYIFCKCKLSEIESSIISVSKNFCFHINIPYIRTRGDISCSYFICCSYEKHISWWHCAASFSYSAVSLVRFSILLKDTSARQIHADSWV